MLLGVSLHYRALSFSPFPLSSWVLALRCLFLLVGGVRSVLRHSTSPFLSFGLTRRFRFLSFGPGASCGSVLRHSTSLTLSTLTLPTGSVKAQHLFRPFSLCFASCLFALCVSTQRCIWKYKLCLSLYDRIIDLSNAFANHFNNLLALDLQEKTVQVALMNCGMVLSRNGNVRIFMLESVDIHPYFMNWKALISRQATIGH